MDALTNAIDDLAVAFQADPLRLNALPESVRKKIVYFDAPDLTDLGSV